MALQIYDGNREHHTADIALTVVVGQFGSAQRELKDLAVVHRRYSTQRVRAIRAAAARQTMAVTSSSRDAELDDALGHVIERSGLLAVADVSQCALHEPVIAASDLHELAVDGKHLRREHGHLRYLPESSRARFANEADADFNERDANQRSEVADREYPSHAARLAAFRHARHWSPFLPR